MNKKARKLKAINNKAKNLNKSPNQSPPSNPVGSEGSNGCMIILIIILFIPVFLVVIFLGALDAKVGDSNGKVIARGIDSIFDILKYSTSPKKPTLDEINLENIKTLKQQVESGQGSANDLWLYSNIITSDRTIGKLGIDTRGEKYKKDRDAKSKDALQSAIIKGSIEANLEYAQESLQNLSSSPPSEKIKIYTHALNIVADSINKSCITQDIGAFKFVLGNASNVVDITKLHKVSTLHGNANWTYFKLSDSSLNIDKNLGSQVAKVYLLDARQCHSNETKNFIYRFVNYGDISNNAYLLTAYTLAKSIDDKEDLEKIKAKVPKIQLTQVEKESQRLLKETL